MRVGRGCGGRCGALAGSDATGRRHARPRRGDGPLATVELVDDGDGDAVDETLLERLELLLEVERKRRGERAEELAQVIGAGMAHAPPSGDRRARVCDAGGLTYMEAAHVKTWIWAAIIVPPLVGGAIYLSTITPPPATQAEKDRALLDATGGPPPKTVEPAPQPAAEPPQAGTPADPPLPKTPREMLSAPGLWAAKMFFEVLPEIRAGKGPTFEALANASKQLTESLRSSTSEQGALRLALSFVADRAKDPRVRMLAAVNLFGVAGQSLAVADQIVFDTLGKLEPADVADVEEPDGLRVEIVWLTMSKGPFGFKFEGVAKAMAPDVDTLSIDFEVRDGDDVIVDNINAMRWQPLKEDDAWKFEATGFKEAPAAGRFTFSIK